VFRRLLVLVLLALAGVVGFGSTSTATATTTSGAARYTYDSRTNTRVDNCAIGVADAATTQLGDAREGSGSPTAAPRGTSTIVFTRNNATEAEQAFFRGAKPGEAPSFSPRPNEFKVDADGLLKPTHGVSEFDNPTSVTFKGICPPRDRHGDGSERTADHPARQRSPAL
jgi:hypothetical protein